MFTYTGEIMNYILKNAQEPERLNDQSSAEAYSLERELSSLQIMKGMRVLDAGCGSGVLCRYLENNFSEIALTGCDISVSSLRYCRENSNSKKTLFIEHDFVEGPLNEKYDLVVSRLVFHHLSLSQQKQAIRNLRSSLTSGGVLCLIDVDGLFLNLGTSHEKLLSQMELARSRFGGNIVSARYFPAFLRDAGFKDIDWRLETLDFRHEARELEVEQWRQRFESSLEFYVRVFGTEFEARKFLKLYLEEASKPETTLFYNKFIVTAYSP